MNKDINDKPEREGKYKVTQALILRAFKRIATLYGKGKKENRTHNLPTMRKEASFQLETGCFFSALWAPVYIREFMPSLRKKTHAEGDTEEGFRKYRNTPPGGGMI